MASECVRRARGVTFTPRLPRFWWMLTPFSPLRPSVTLLILTRNEWKEFMSFAEEVKKTEKVRESWAFVVLSCFNSSKDLLTLLFDTPAAPLVIGVAAAVFPSG